jgi:hypothetical protein
VAGETAGGLLTFARNELLAHVKAAQERIWLVSPFLTDTTATSIVEVAKQASAGDRRLLVALTERAVRSRVLDPKALRRFDEAGFTIASVPNLHAKLSIVDGWALVGSGNLTGSGLGGDKGANMELGVVLTKKQLGEATRIHARWWKRGKVVTDEALGEYEDLPVIPQGKALLGDFGKPIVVRGTSELSEILGEDPDTAESRSYWVKSNYHRWDEESWWQERKWISDWRKAPYAVGDLVVLYLAGRDGGPAACAAVTRVTEPSTFAREFVVAERDLDAADRWPYVTKIEVLADVPPFEGVSLGLIGKNGQSVQGGYTHIDRAQFEVLARALMS